HWPSGFGRRTAAPALLLLHDAALGIASSSRLDAPVRRTTRDQIHFLSGLLAVREASCAFGPGNWLLHGPPLHEPPLGWRPFIRGGARGARLRSGRTLPHLGHANLDPALGRRFASSRFRYSRSVRSEPVLGGRHS